MKKGFFIISYFILGATIVFLLLANTNVVKNNKNSISPNENRDSSYEFDYLLKIHPVPLPEKITFCNENVPLNIYYVRESLERELLINSYLHASTIQNIKRANRFFPIIEPILKANNIPDDMKYLAIAESNLLNVVSPSKAAGFWQFLKETAKSYNLEVNDEIDERYNLEKATVAACAYLQESYLKYGTWAASAASYNMGQNGLDRVIKNQKDSIYYNLDLNRETSRYVYRIIALKTILENPQNYGFYIKKSELYPLIPTDSILVDSTIENLPDFAKSLNLNYKILVDFNPWLRKYTLPNKSKKSYKLLIPKEGYLDYDNKLITDKDDSWFQGYGFKEL